MHGLGKTAAIAALIAGALSGIAYAALDQIDPNTVPQGELALTSKVDTPFKLKVGNGPEHIFRHGAEITVEHFRFQPGETSGWHSHAGPVFVEVVTGTLTLYEAANNPTCASKRYSAGTGFLEAGFGNIHDARNEGANPVDIYVTDILPPGSGEDGLYTPKPDGSNPACPFPS